MKKSNPAFLVLILLPLLAGCAAPFDITTETQTIEIPNTVGIYVEKELDVPAEARNPRITYTEVTVLYTVRKNDAFSAALSLYASEDLTADHVKKATDEKTAEITLLPGDAEKSGSAVSGKLRNILNNGQERFVVGVENLSLNLFSSLLMDVRVRIRGTYSLF